MIGIILTLCLGWTDGLWNGGSFQSTLQDGTQQKRHVIADKSRLREKESVIRDLFADQYRDRSVAGQAKLADDLLETALQTNDDPPGQYVLLTESIRMAIASGNTAAACQSTEQMILRFQVDPLKARCELIDDLARIIKNPDSWDQLKTHVRPLIHSAIKTNDFESAEQLLQSLNRGARRANDTFLVETTLSKLKSLKLIARQHASIQSHFKTLEQIPDDPTANQAVGEYRCFWKQDFESGLPNLAKGTDERMRSIAAAELDGASDNSVRIEIADQWWAVGGDLRGDSAKAAITHAVELYRVSAESAQGIDKKRIESRIADFEAASLAALPNSLKAVFGKPWRVTWENGHATWERTVFAEDGSMRSFAQNRTWNNRFVIHNNTIRILSATKEFVFTIEFYGSNLVCRKFDAKTGKPLDRGMGILLND